MMRRKEKQINADKLLVLRKAKPPLPFRVGDRVRLNSGGPVGLVVELGESDFVVVA